MHETSESDRHVGVMPPVKLRFDALIGANCGENEINMVVSYPQSNRESFIETWRLCI